MSGGSCIDSSSSCSSPASLSNSPRSVSISSPEQSDPSPPRSQAEILQPSPLEAPDNTSNQLPDSSAITDTGAPALASLTLTSQESSDSSTSSTDFSDSTDPSTEIDLQADGYGRTMLYEIVTNHIDYPLIEAFYASIMNVPEEIFYQCDDDGDT